MTTKIASIKQITVDSQELYLDISFARIVGHNLYAATQFARSFVYFVYSRIKVR